MASVVNVLKGLTVGIVSTVSSGKSTLLNAILGRRLLPSGSAACTACRFEVALCAEATDFRFRVKKSGSRFSRWQVATAETLSESNGLGADRIQVVAPVPLQCGLPGGRQIVFVDTPGLNNSSDKSHREVFRGAMSLTRFDVLLVLLNGSALRTTDEWNMLEDVRQCLSTGAGRPSVLFVLNKMDAFFHRGSEDRTFGEIVHETEEYLLNRVGFENPAVVATWASLALSCREAARSVEKRLIDIDAEEERRFAVKKARNHCAEIKKANASFARRYGISYTSRNSLELSGIPLVERWLVKKACGDK